MDITFSSIRSKEVINLYDGKRLGHIFDVYIDKDTGSVLGYVVPGLKKVFKKSDDIFIPLANIKKIGDDVILVKLSPENEEPKVTIKNEKDIIDNKTYARYRRTPPKEK